MWAYIDNIMSLLWHIIPLFVSKESKDSAIQRHLLLI